VWPFVILTALLKKNPLPFFAVKQGIEAALSAHAGRFVVVPLPNGIAEHAEENFIAQFANQSAGHFEVFEGSASSSKTRRQPMPRKLTKTCHSTIVAMRCRPLRQCAFAPSSGPARRGLLRRSRRPPNHCGAVAMLPKLDGRDGAAFSDIVAGPCFGSGVAGFAQPT
jgi:hypothetical protein